jgi:CheY-like chemotaxis protein
MTRTILLADESVTIRKVVELTFGDTDIHVEAVATGGEALERLDTLKPDLVLADVAMPGPNGYEICRRVKASSRPVPVLLLAGTFEPFDAERARECGADGHLVKPFESRTLIRRVEDLLARGPVSLPARPERAADLELEAVLDEVASRDHDAIPSAAEPFEPEEIPAATLPPTPGSDLGTIETSLEPPASAAETRAVPAIPAAEVRSRAGRPPLSAEEIDAIARAVVERLGGEALREVAWEVVPDLAEILIRERLREIEREENGRG